MKLSDVMYVFMPVYEDDGEQHIMASHAERLRMSSCFISSNQNSRNSTGLKPYKDGMTCVTCHNPHVSVRADGPGRFNTICTNCHAKKQVSDCSESIKLRKVKNDNCTACHMPLHGAADIPHVSIHDHRIGIHRDQRTSKRTDDLLKGIRCIHEQTVPSIVEAEAFVNYVEKFNMPESLLDSALIRLNKSAQDKEALCLRIRISYLRREYSYVRKLVSDNPDLINELAVVEPENKDAWTAYRISESFQVTSGIPSNVQESIRWLEKACKLAPLIPEFCSKLGTAYASAGRFKESEKKYENLIREHPEYAPGYCNLGYLRLTQGNRSEAMRLLKKSIQLDPDYLQAHLNLASYYLSIGDRKNAISSLEKVLNLDPGNVQAKAALRQI
jgi:FimV-like protein